MIYDCFLFRDELDMLELRLNVLAPVVDKFVLVASPETFSREAKPLVYAGNRSRFQVFADKIIYVLDDEPLPPETNIAASRLREIHQRNSIVKGLTSVQDDDLVMVSDVDEIINPDCLTEQLQQGLAAKASQCVLSWEMLFYYYYMDCRLSEPPYWACSRVTSWAQLKCLTPQQTRVGIRPTDQIIPNGGWHFSFLGGPKAIQHKVREYSDTWLNTPAVDNSQWVEECLAQAKDIWNRNQTMGFVEEFGRLPKYIQQNAEHYWNLGWFRHKPPGVA